MWVAIDKVRLARATGKVVKAAEFTQLLSGCELLDEVRRYTRELRASADAEIAAARARGYADGVEEARTELTTLITATTAKLDAAFIGLEARIVNTVMNAIQRILHAIDERELMERLIRRVLAEGRAEKQLRLRVAASQYDDVNRWLDEILREFPQVEFIDVLKDPQGTFGTCVLESEFGIVDASLDRQLSAVRRGLVNAFVAERVAAGGAR